MIDKTKIHAVGERLGFAPWQAEKDYLQHLFLRGLYARISEELVFKGGTCLQKAYGLHRFSRDLDFNLNKKIDVVSLVERVTRLFYDMGLENRITKTEETPYATNFLIVFDSAMMKNSLTVQISKREKLELAPRPIGITPLYAAIPPYLAMCMDEREIAAEKIRAIHQRAFPRDVYDLWFLLRKEVRPPVKLVNKKLAKLRAHYDKKTLMDRIIGVEKNWLELADLLPAYPLFSTVAKEIEEKL